MPGSLVVEVIQVPLPGSRKARRRANPTPYPAVFAKDTADLNIWHQMFLTSHLMGLTMHKFATPPLSVLDLGCGTGYWAIEASRQWKDSKITGFDTQNIQPQFFKGVEWVHGDFLQKLPFPSESFDFVRMSCLGLAVPEDEWHYVLEEVRRVMKHGAVLEIIAEDMLFPCASELLRTPAPVRVSYAPQQKRHSRPNEFLTPPDDERSPGSDNSSTLSARDSLLPYVIKSTLHTSASDLSHSVLALPTESTESEHPQDHTRLKASWDAMLAARFLCPKLVSLLPFYLSASFCATTQHPPLEIALPPNSGLGPSATTPPRNTGHERGPAASAFDLSEGAVQKPVRTQSVMSNVSSLCPSAYLTLPSHPEPRSQSPRPQAPTWSTMHLARTVSTVKSCKDAIWKEYKALYAPDAVGILSRTRSSEENYTTQPAARTAFEVDWRNWELDMQDRIAMRDNLALHTSWSLCDAEADRPAWYAWRQKLECKPGTGSSPSGHLVAPWNPEDLCTYMRVFTAVKT